MEDLQLATVKRLLPKLDTLPDDDALADAVMGVTEVYEDTVYALAHDVIAILRAYANVDKATSGKADLPMLVGCCNRCANISPRWCSPGSSARRRPPPCRAYRSIWRPT